MQRTRDELLADTALADEMDRQLRGTEPLDFAFDGSQWLARADQLGRDAVGLGDLDERDRALVARRHIDDHAGEPCDRDEQLEVVRVEAIGTHALVEIDDAEYPLVDAE